ncbi:MAG: HNH endonuclease, partial [Actinomycetota bacterium]
TRGCAECGATIDRCQAHHLQEWLEHGPTDIENLQLLCHPCHGHAHRGSRGDPKRHRRTQPHRATLDHEQHELTA